MSDGIDWGSDSRSDPELVAAANRGEERAFATLYYRQRDWVCALAFRFCGNEQDAVDVLQDAFLYFFNKFPGFELRAELRTFLYPVVKHLALSRKQAGARNVPLDDGAAENLPAPEPPDDQAGREAVVERVRRLPEPMREVMLLRFADGMEIEAIARALEIPAGTVKSRLHKALAELRRRMAPDTD